MAPMFHVVGCVLIFSRFGVAVDIVKTSSLKQMAAFTSTRHHPLHTRRSYGHDTFQLQVQSTRPKNPLLELVTNVASGKSNESGDIESVHDFDADLASEIQDALLSADVDGEGDNSRGATDKAMNGSTEETTKQRPPIENKAPKYVPELPPHTALAQVLANQFGVDLREVSPSSKGRGGKVTAEDVEYHAWKIAQPPCTSEALELAHSLGLDLNDLYDDEDREYVMELGDVQLYQENLGSLKMTSQIKKGIQYDNSKKGKRKKKISALDKRMGHNMDKLSQKAMQLAGTLTGGIVQQVQQAVGLNGIDLFREAGVLADMNGEVENDITTVEDFDSDLASEIQDALSSANFSDDNGEVEDFDAEFASEIQDALSSANFNDENVEDNIHAVEPSPTGFTKEELQSMTCVHLKEHLRQRGMKLSGKKAELVDRLLDGGAADNDKNGSDDDTSDSSPFFASIL